MKPKQVEVTIMGQGYLLGCPEGGDVLLAAAVAHVDREMCAVRDAGKVKVRERIAVLSALNLAYQLAERPALAAPGPGADGQPGDGQPDVTALVQRIDAALGDDDHLL
jgi:cell division protein ZapA